MYRLLGFLALAAVVSCSAPKFGFQSPETEAIAVCRDGQLSPGESDVDCGKSCATPCSSGKACFDDFDCSSAFCSAGICTEQTCSDALQNQDETDIDCGGNTGCDRCGPGKACLGDADCNGGACREGKCRAASCDDSLKNQSESDVDCGGPCGPCATGKACNSAGDCALSLCTGGKCRTQTCADGLLNQDETDTDCGGDSGCARCATGQHCSANGDCNHARCAKGSCQPASCSDGVLNDSETDVDCGGSCDPCANKASCLVASDCVSRVCPSATRHCAVASCSDGVLNGSEPTVDCGTSCDTKCQVADSCQLGTDCASGKCFNLHCVPSAPSNTPLLTMGWLASASHTFSTDTAPRFALDGDPNTHWTNGTPQVPGMWFAVDMTKPQVFFSLEVICVSQPSDYGKTMKLSGSLDGQNFKQLRTGIAGETSLKISFNDPQYARYLKLELLDSTGGLWWRIDDLRVLQ